MMFAVVVVISSVISLSEWFDSRSFVPQCSRNVLGFVKLVSSIILLASGRVGHLMYDVLEPGHNRSGIR